ncbi:MAG: DUF4159 domain-containing protein [Pseudomonadota bacterium]
MNALFGLTFTTPWLLWGLIALPALWILLRSVPPAPVVERFPAVALLLGLDDEDTTPARTPWWLLALRVLAIAAVIIGLSGPRIVPDAVSSGSNRLAVLVDASWASAQTWAPQKDVLENVLATARADGRAIALVDLSQSPSPALVKFDVPEVAISQSETIRPQSWKPDYAGWAAALDEFEEFDTVWLSDGIGDDLRDRLTSIVNAKGTLTVYQSSRQPVGLSAPRLDAGALIVRVLRTGGDGREDHIIEAVGPDPAGITRILGEQPVTFDPGVTSADVAIEMPTELRNRVTQLQIAGIPSAGAVVLSDSSLKRKRVGLYSPVADEEATNLIDPLHYLRNALVENSDTFEADLGPMIDAGPDVLILSDVAILPEADRTKLERWVADGGVLVRFAGPRLAAVESQVTDADPLLPVQIRAGGREVGGAMSWGSPKLLQAFPEGSPFFGLEVPDDVLVSSQILAQPDPQLSEKTWASLQDGTPLVTADRFGGGQIILFHVTANADWSNLPISILFVQMLERLSILAAASTSDAATLEGRLWTPENVLDGFGALQDGSAFSAVDGGRLASETSGPTLRPGIYTEGTQAVAFNAIPDDQILNAARFPVGTDVRSLAGGTITDFTSFFLTVAIIALFVDVFASLWLQGGILPRRFSQAAATVAALFVGTLGSLAEAQGVDPVYAANNTVLAYVITGDERQDRLSEAGLVGLSAELTRRTSIEPGRPVGVDLATDPLELFPFIYWPVTEGQRALPADTIARVNSFLRTGGMILFDTRDANLGRNASGDTANSRILQQIASGLAIPPLEPIPDDHVMTRAFYLIQDYPGRYFGARVWVEAAPPDAVRGEGMPFRNLNDGVSPVVLGGNDWAAAWAIDDNGSPMRPVGRGSAGDLQREFAYRFGVNLVMYVMTGNYKSDQVHVPALLQRLGN